MTNQEKLKEIKMALEALVTLGENDPGTSANVHQALEEIELLIAHKILGV